LISKIFIKTFEVVILHEQAKQASVEDRNFAMVEFAMHTERTFKEQRYKGQQG